MMLSRRYLSSSRGREKGFLRGEDTHLRPKEIGNLSLDVRGDARDARSVATGVSLSYIEKQEKEMSAKMRFLK